jgi:hypothetical protein
LVEMAAPTVIKKVNNFKDLTLDVAERALVISYSTDSILSTGPTETSYHKKKIRIKTIEANTDLSLMADAIVKSADVIPAARKPLVIELLSQLRAGAPTAAAAAVTSRPKPADVARDTEKKAFEAAAAAAAAAPKEAPAGAAAAAAKPPKAGSGPAPTAGASAPTEVADWDDPTARMADVDAYLEKLYDDDLSLKTEAAKKIVALAQHASNLIALCENAVRGGMENHRARPCSSNPPAPPPPPFPPLHAGSPSWLLLREFCATTIKSPPS